MGSSVRKEDEESAERLTVFRFLRIEREREEEEEGKMDETEWEMLGRNVISNGGG